MSHCVHELQGWQSKTELSDPWELYAIELINSLYQCQHVFLTVVHCKTNSCIHAAGNLKKDANCPSCNDCKMIISILYNSISSTRAGKEKLNENKCSTNILSIRPFQMMTNRWLLQLSAVKQWSFRTPESDACLVFTLGKDAEIIRKNCIEAEDLCRRLFLPKT